MTFGVWPYLGRLREYLVPLRKRVLSALFPYPIAACTPGHPTPASLTPGVTWGSAAWWQPGTSMPRDGEGVKVPWDPQQGQRCCGPHVDLPVPEAGLFILAHHCKFCNGVFFCTDGTMNYVQKPWVNCAGDLSQASLPWSGPTTAPSFFTWTPSMGQETAQNQPLTLCFSPVLSHIAEGSGAYQRSPQHNWYSTCSFFLDTFP